MLPSIAPKEPAWWYGEGSGGWGSWLQPLGALYGSVAAARFALASPYRARMPVICVGNFTAGGTGKTPLVLHLCQHLTKAGCRPSALTRGHGGRQRGPHRVGSGDTAFEVGDEALLLAGAAPTMVARNRADGARAIEAAGDADVIVMDDGLQNPQLAKNLSFALVDGARGLGNGRVIPAGPLRAPLEFQLGLADAIVVNGLTGTSENVADWLRQLFNGPVLRCASVPDGNTKWLEGQRVVAWAGIGAPQRFFTMLESLGASLVERIAFGDHQGLGAHDAERLLGLAHRHGAMLVSTEKDLARLRGGTRALAELSSATRTLKVKLAFGEADAERLSSLIQSSLKRQHS